MRAHLIFVALVALLLGGCATSSKKAGGVSAGHPAKPGERMTVRTTAYTHTEAGGAKNAIGGRLRFGGDTYSAAADWSWLPLGTRFRMLENGRHYVVEDYGSALVGRKTIDLYMPNRRTMNAWGVRNVEIEIVEWGSKVMSLRLLQGRQGNSHVRRMVSSLRSGQTKKDSRS